MKRLYLLTSCLALTAIIAAQTSTPTTASSQSGAGSTQEKARVFITDSQSWGGVVGSAGGSNGTFAAHSHGGAHPQTAEL